MMDVPVIPPLTLEKLNSLGQIHPIFPDEIYVGIDLARGKDMMVTVDIEKTVTNNAD